MPAIQSPELANILQQQNQYFSSKLNPISTIIGKQPQQLATAPVRPGVSMADIEQTNKVAAIGRKKKAMETAPESIIPQASAASEEDIMKDIDSGKYDETIDTLAKEGYSEDDIISAISEEIGSTQTKETPQKTQEELDQEAEAKEFRFGTLDPAYKKEEIESAGQLGKAGMFAANLGTSSLNILSGLGNMVIHPKDTSTGLATIAEGLAQGAVRPVLEKLMPDKIGQMDTKEQEAAFNAINEMIVKRYGTLEDFKRTSMEDPMGVIGDVLSVVEGGAGLIGKTAKVGEVSTLGKIAEGGRTIEKMAGGLNPYTQLPKIVAKPVIATGEKILSKTGDLGAQILGKTTGTSAETIKTAFREGAAPEFKETLRGAKAPEQILQETQAGLQEMKNARSKAYGDQYKILEQNKTPIDLSSLKKEFEATIKNDYGVKIDADGKLDFSQSKITQPKSIANIEGMYDDLTNWKDNTPAGVDILKQRMQDRYVGTPETAKSDRLSTAMSKGTKDKIVQAVPEYAEMTAGFEKATKEINEITKNLSLGNKAAVQTSLTKIMSVLKENFPARQDMIKLIEESTGKNIQAQVAGASLQPYMAKGLAGVITGGGIVFGQLANPAFWGGLLVASPRLIGEIASAVGTTKAKLLQTAKYITESSIGKTVSETAKGIKPLTKPATIGGIKVQENQ